MSTQNELLTLKEIETLGWIQELFKSFYPGECFLKRLRERVPKPELTLLALDITHVLQESAVSQKKPVTQA